MPLASVVHSSTPGSFGPGNIRRGASGTPGFSVSSSVAAPSSASQSAWARPPRASGDTSCVARRHPRAAPLPRSRDR
eukprot:3946258-Pleurochrysis_carterae.AAC.1